MLLYSAPQTHAAKFAGQGRAGGKDGKRREEREGKWEWEGRGKGENIRCRGPRRGEGMGPPAWPQHPRSATKWAALYNQSINTYITRHGTEARATVPIMSKQREMS